MIYLLIGGFLLGEGGVGVIFFYYKILRPKFDDLGGLGGKEKREQTNGRAAFLCRRFLPASMRTSIGEKYCACFR